MFILSQRNSLNFLYAGIMSAQLAGRRWLAVLIALLFITHVTPGRGQEKWCATYTCPNCAAHGAGPNTQTACYPSRAECENILRQNFSGNYYGTVTACTSSGAAGGAGGADGSVNGLVRQSSDAVAKGIVHGNSQMVGMGLAGFGVALLLGGGDADPQQAARAEQERQAEMQRQQEESRLAQEAIMRQQELARQRIMHDLKDSTDVAGGLQIKNDSAPLMVAEVSSSLGSRTLIPVVNGAPVVLGGLQMKGVDDSVNDKMASNSGFDTSGQLLGANAHLPDVATPTSAPVLTRQQKIQQALQQDPDYSALSKKQEQEQTNVDDAQKKLDDLQQQKLALNEGASSSDIDRQIAIQSQHLDIAKQDVTNTENQMKTIETKIEGTVEIVD